MELATLGGDAAREGRYFRASAPSFEDSSDQEGRLSATTTVSSIEATMTVSYTHLTLPTTHWV